MMVNQFNNNLPPWPSTVPSQMPWLDPYVVGGPVPFSQPPYNQDNTTSHPSIAPTVPATGMLTQPLNPSHSFVPTTNHIPQVDQFMAPPQIGPPLANPFEPQPTIGHQWTGGNAQPIVGRVNQAAHYHAQTNAIPAPLDTQFASSSLTQLPQCQRVSPSCSDSTPFECQKKRNSFEMEDEQTAREAPPTKQQLSECKLFKRFGTLQLDGERLVGPGEEEETDSDSSDEYASKGSSVQDRKVFNRYVYLLFKDKKSNNLFNDATSHAMDKLIRDEREKLSKAVILWSPPLKESLVDSLNQDDGSDEEEFRYNDHRDFLKKPEEHDGDPVLITEVENDMAIANACQNDCDDVMHD